MEDDDRSRGARRANPDENRAEGVSDDPSGRRLALRGRIGRRVTCTSYELRPSGCRFVGPGGACCPQCRRERGVER